jgi:hypothetical protein
VRSSPERSAGAIGYKPQNLNIFRETACRRVVERTESVG